jgi:conjugal transfer/entry exclusion protein
VLSPLFLIIKPNIRQNAKKPNNSIIDQLENVLHIPNRPL